MVGIDPSCTAVNEPTESFNAPIHPYIRVPNAPVTSDVGIHIDDVYAEYVGSRFEDTCSDENVSQLS